MNFPRFFPSDLWWFNVGGSGYRHGCSKGMQLQTLIAPRSTTANHSNDSHPQPTLVALTNTRCPPPSCLIHCHRPHWLHPCRLYRWHCEPSPQRGGQSPYRQPSSHHSAQHQLPHSSQVPCTSVGPSTNNLHLA
jgi:hypothetical protein